MSTPERAQSAAAVIAQAEAELEALRRPPLLVRNTGIRQHSNVA